MSGWVAVPAVLSLRAAFDHEFPTRARGADGTIGDEKHRAEISDHNPDDTPGSHTEQTDADSVAEVRALDITAELNRPGVTMEDVVELLRQAELAGRIRVFRYIIWNRRIAGVSSGWRWQTYPGADPHTGHAHFDVQAGAGSGPTNPENYTGPWPLEEIMTRAEILSALTEWASSPAGQAAIADAVTGAAVAVGSESWQLGNAVGYTARKAFEAKRAIDALAVAVSPPKSS